MVGIPVPHKPAAQADGPRPVNLRTDLAPLADLIEVAFASSMDSNGRAAVREMRYLSRVGFGLNMLAGMNELAQGMGLGYVWVADGKLVGNVSVYPAPSNMPKTWVIVNVAVYPEYQGQGIATRLMQSTMDMIRERGGQRAILQVDADNEPAKRVYLKLGFKHERAWTAWRRNSLISRPPPLPNGPHIAHRATGEWRAEYALAERVRPDDLGGIGWLRPLHIAQFRQPFWKQLTDWLTLQTTERLVIRSDDESQIHASMWIENGFASPSTHLTLLVDPEYEGLYDEALLNTVVRRFGGNALMLEHPADRETTNALLRRYQFSPRREVIHMRWDVR